MTNVDRSSRELPQVGVEEEFLLVDATTRRPAPRIARIIGEARATAGDLAQHELHRAQIETASPPCDELEQLGEELRTLRSKMASAARAHDALVVASASFPDQMGAAGRLITADPRYETMAEANGLLVREQLICGCHVHVTTESPDAAIAIMNRARRWLPYMLALSANSPFWEGEDTCFASFRTEVWARWPTAGPPGAFTSIEEYHDVLDALVDAEVILDRAMAYWDVRPSDRYPTLEFRIADVMLSVDDAVALAGLYRALVVRCGSEHDPAPPLRPELLRAASWRAARTGLSDTLIDPVDGSTRPAREAIKELLAYLAPALDQLGDGERVTALVEQILEGGNGADRQRAALASRGEMSDVIELASV